jgi:hydrogenase maturation factor
MRKLTFKINESEQTKEHSLEIITDRTPEWTKSQYLRNRVGVTMELISDEETKETEPLSREI